MLTDENEKRQNTVRNVLCSIDEDLLTDFIRYDLSGLTNLAIGTTNSCNGGAACGQIAVDDEAAVVIRQVCATDTVSDASATNCDRRNVGEWKTVGCDRATETSDSDREFVIRSLEMERIGGSGRMRLIGGSEERRRSSVALSQTVAYTPCRQTFRVKDRFGAIAFGAETKTNRRLGISSSSKMQSGRRNEGFVVAEKLHRNTVDEGQWLFADPSHRNPRQRQLLCQYREIRLREDIGVGLPADLL
ncbi:unnamed protein product [Caenorhabditis auriculariae]|uniref:Uncharacterized protein n=1 Tax=Caenorhabditis auriculariae TaxID=2777116 RepID=A0A8S1HLI0_9PELO|nr:unnamed protein product [Caenorhabditis auriculariae]